MIARTGDGIKERTTSRFEVASDWMMAGGEVVVMVVFLVDGPSSHPYMAIDVPA